MGNFFSESGYVTIREKNGYGDGVYYRGDVKGNLYAEIDEHDDEPFDCGDEDKICFTENLYKGTITLSGEAAEKFKDASGIFDIRCDGCWYHVPSAQKKYVEPNGNVIITF